MKFKSLFFYKTAFHIAVENGNREIVELLLSREELDINIPYVSMINFA